MNRESFPSIRTIPSGRPYEGPVLALWKEKKEALKKDIEQLKPDELILRLEKFRDYLPGSVLNISDAGGTDNTFEMIALYQRALQILSNGKEGESLEVDTHFGKKTHQALLAFQKNILLFRGKDIDGLPGPKTTKALMDKLSVSMTKIAPAPDDKSGVSPKDGGSAPLKSTTPIDRKDPGSLGSLIRGVQQLKELQNPMENENVYVRSLVQKAQSSLGIAELKIGNIGSYYSGPDARRIEYAVIKQKDKDGEYEYYVYDKVENGERRIYRTDKDFKVLVVARVDFMGKITIEKQIGPQYTIRSAAFMPTPKIIPKTNH